MGKFLAPRITVADLATLTPDESEVLYVEDATPPYYCGGDGSTLGGIALFPTTPGGASWTDVVVTDANFTAANDTRYYLASGVLSANRNVNMSAITTRCMFIIEEDYDVFHLTFTTTTVYTKGGADVMPSPLGQWPTTIEKIGSKLIQTN